MPRTKIVCTIGPSSRSPEILRQIILAGLNVARLNFSHGTHSEHKKVISSIRKLSRELSRPVAILQDLAGPKIRVGKIEAGGVTLQAGSHFSLTSRKVLGNHSRVSVSYAGLPRDVRPGDTLLLSDGALELEIVETTDQDIKCRVIIGGPLTSHKGINLPSRSIKAPSLTAKDRRDLAFGIKQGVDYIALSFVRHGRDVMTARRFIQNERCAIPIVAKIEKHEALANIDEIISLADAVMVARGDLGVEIPLEKVPHVQKMLIHKSNKIGKPVITATQMLRSMVDQPRPTRAEVTDIANAVLDGTDAVMLSEETAVGKYPVEAVKTMGKIAADAESSFPYAMWTKKWTSVPGKSLAEAVAQAACSLAEQIDARILVTFTQSGSTARLVSKYRPCCPILAPTPLPSTYRRLALVWGVIPVLSANLRTTDEMIRKALQSALRSGLVRKGQKVVITAGVPVGVPGTTNLIKAEVIE